MREEPRPVLDLLKKSPEPRLTIGDHAGVIDSNNPGWVGEAYWLCTDCGSDGTREELGTKPCTTNPRDRLEAVLPNSTLEIPREGQFFVVMMPESDPHGMVVQHRQNDMVALRNAQAHFNIGNRSVSHQYPVPDSCERTCLRCNTNGTSPVCWSGGI